MTLTRFANRWNEAPVAGVAAPPSTGNVNVVSLITVTVFKPLYAATDAPEIVIWLPLFKKCDLSPTNVATDPMRVNELALHKSNSACANSRARYAVSYTHLTLPTSDLV